MAAKEVQLPPFAPTAPQIWRQTLLWLGLPDGGLLGSQCSKCGQQSFPPRPICPKCRQNGRNNVDHEQKASKQA